MVQWEEKRGIVAMGHCCPLCCGYVCFAGNEISGATFTGRLLAGWLPGGASGARIKRYVLIVRKLGHFSAYAILTLLVYWAAARTKKITPRHSARGGAASLFSGAGR